MGRVSRVLNLGINVETKGSEQLDAASRKLKRLAESFAELKRLSGDVGGAQEILGALRGDIADQSTTDANRVLAEQIRLERQAIAAETQRIKLLAQVAVGNRDHAEALRVLNAEQGRYLPQSREFLELELAKIRVINQQTAALERLEAAKRRDAAAGTTTAARRVRDQARLLAAQGNLSGAIGHIAVNVGDFSGDEQIRLLTMKARLERQYRNEVIRTAEAVTAAAAAEEARLLRMNRIQVRIALAAHDYAGALREIQAAQGSVLHKSEAWMRLEERRVAVLRAQDRFEKARVLENERRNNRNLNALAAQILQESQLMSLRGDRSGALGFLQGKLGTFTAGTPQHNRLLIEQQRLLNAINAEEARRVSLLARTAGFLNGGVNLLLKTLGSFFLINAAVQMVGHSVSSLVYKPLIGITKEVLQVTDKFRTFEITFAGIAGSMRTARDLVKDIVRSAEGLPISPLEAIESVRQTAFIPSIAQRLQQPSGRLDFLESIQRTLVGLGTINPVQGSAGAGFALREALAGQFRSLRFRFDISPDIVAATIGKQLADLRRDPALTLTAIRTFVESFVGPEVLDELNNTLQGQGKRFRGVLERFLNTVGDAGIYDSFVDRLKRITTSLDIAIDSDRGKQVARQVSSTLQEFFDSTLDIGSRFLQSLTGRNVDLRAAFDEGDAVAVLEALAAVTEGLKDFAVSMNSLAADLTGFLGAQLNRMGIMTLAQKRERIADLETLPSMEEYYARMGIDLNRGSRVPLGDSWLSRSLFGRKSRTAGEESELARLRADVARAEGLFQPPAKPPRFGADAAGALGRAGFDPRETDFIQAAEERAKVARAALRQSVLGLSTFFQTTEDSLRETSDQIGPDLLSLQDVTEGFTAGLERFATGETGIPSLLENAGHAIDDLNKVREAAAAALADRQNALNDLLQKSVPQFIMQPDGRFELEVGPNPFSGSQAEFDAQKGQLEQSIKQIDAFLGKPAHGDVAGTGILGLIDRLTGTMEATNSIATQLQRAGAVRLRFAEETIRDLPPASQVGSISGILAEIGGGFDAADSGATDFDSLRRAGMIPRDPQSVNRLINLIEASTSARLAMKGNPGDVGRESIAIVEDLIAQYKELGDVAPSVFHALEFELENLKDRFDELRRVTREFAESTSQAFGQALSDSMVDAIANGANGIEDILRNLSTSILKTIADAITRIAFIESLLNPLLNAAFGTNLSTNNLFGFGTPPPQAGLPGSPFYGPPSPFAEGGVVNAAMGLLTRTQGMVPLAGGRWARTVEDGTPEAIIPLRGGGIPVRFPDRPRAPEQPIDVNIVNVLDSASVARSAAARSPRTFVNPVVADANGRGVMHRTVRSVRR
jgi:hypothetical protein